MNFTVTSTEELPHGLRLICEGKTHLPLRKVNLHREAVGLPPFDSIPDVPTDPGMLQLARNFGTAVVRHAMNLGRKVSADVHQQRLEICANCPSGLFSNGKCRHKACGCNLQLKTSWASESCPMGHWQAETDAPPEPRNIRTPPTRASMANASVVSGNNSKNVFRPMPFSVYRTAFNPQSGTPRFVTLEDLSRDIHRLASQLPDDIIAIAGVSRSGVYPATLLSMLLHLPLYVVRHHQGDIVPAGNGWRLKEGAPTGKGRTLFVDDTTMTGNSLLRTKHIARSFSGAAAFASVYVNPAAKAKPDYWVHDLPWPHLLEWNLFNSVMMDSCAFDFDGILCHDCPPEDDDDGERYQSFLRETRPLYPVRKRPIRLIVTARLEKYRKETVAWMQQWGIKSHQLVMGPWASLQERRSIDVAAWKATQVSSFFRRHGGIRPPMYIESDPRQAHRIAELSSQLVVCPPARRCFGRIK